ncbi:hypothetical protein MPTK1_4g14560 [Marchantia polymorpha subsp. ruderalis]|nr:hypothetical protein MARPO_0070s0025 [Marchantia polymorpha]BBN08798.1 hypothetical protein Mp_4g14560 [Marchantia polymorpha subsp. ruderalis]|eukprot:PTQ35554.1 hypothetical protein MARPO_0070s0025 [Marchantia polymorpha]
MPRAGELIVRLKQSKGIKGDEALGFGKADVFANMSLGGERRSSKVVTDGGSDSVWDEEFSFKIAAYVNLSLYQYLKIFIYDQDYVYDSRRGTCKIDVKNLLDEHEDEVPDKEYPVMFHGDQRGSLIVGFSFKPANVLPVVKPELTSVKSEKEDESTFDHLMHKIQHIGQRRYHKPRKSVAAEQPVVGPLPHIKVHAEKQDEEEDDDKEDGEEEGEEGEEGEQEEEHSGWTSESEPECEEQDFEFDFSFN